MKANKLQTAWIMVRSLYYTGEIIVKALVMSLLGKLDRPHADRYILCWSRKLLGTIGLTYSVHNPHQIDFKKLGRIIFVSNHGSIYDHPLIFLAFPDVTIRKVGKKELFKIPFFGWAMRVGEFIPIDRKNHIKAMRSLEHAKEKLDDGVAIWMAPEGGRTRNGTLREFKKGPFVLAIQTQATIIPFGIRGTVDVLPAESFTVSLNQHAEIHIGEPIDASNYEYKDRDRLSSEIRKQVKALANL